MTASGGLPPMVMIVAYRADDHLTACLRALGCQVSVTVIDNADSESTRQIADRVGVGYLASKSNVGFARAVNLGLSHAWDGMSDVLLLNPDARIGYDNVLVLQRALHLADTRRAAVGPQLVDDDGRPQPSDWPLPSPGQVWFDALGASRLWRGRRFVVGAILLLRAEAIVEVGRLDERYFLYAEEADWQLRAQLAGWSVAVVDEVIAVHSGGASSDDSTVRETYFHASAKLFARCWYGAFGSRLMWTGAVAAALRRSVVGARSARRLGRRTLRILFQRPGSAGTGEIPA